MNSKKSFNKSKKRIVVVDEFGDYGVKAKKDKDGKYSPTKTMGFGISVVRNEKRFTDVSRNYKQKSNIHDEMKGRKRSVSEKEFLAKEICRSGTETYGYYIDKTKDVPDYWNSKNRSDAAIPLLKHSLRDVFKRTKSKDLEVVIDRHAVYRDRTKKEKNFDLAERAVKDVADETGKSVSVEIPSSRKKDRYGDLLQTHDVVSNGIHESLENDNHSIVSILRTKISRITRKV